MSMELIAIISVGVALAGLILNGQRTQRADINSLRERMAHVEGLLEGLLREVFIGRRAVPAEAVAEDAGQYDKR